MFCLILRPQGGGYERKSSALPPAFPLLAIHPFGFSDAVGLIGAGAGTLRVLTFMLAIYTDSQILVFKGTQIRVFDPNVTGEHFL